MFLFRQLVPVSLLAAAALLAGCLPPPPEASPTGNPQPADPGNQVLVPAQPGVGKQGQIIGDGGGLLTTPAAVLFKTKQRVVFEIQIPQAMQLYQAERGHYPLTHDEFMDKIVHFNRIALPELPAGQEYIYDPEKNELMVRRPAD